MYGYSETLGYGSGCARRQDTLVLSGEEQAAARADLLAHAMLGSHIDN
ncbi:hypothetical protein [Janthinobacterium sp. MDB2-8]